MAAEKWENVYEVVLAGLDDAVNLENPPKTKQELEWAAETVTDHVVGAFKTEARP